MPARPTRAQCARGAIAAPVVRVSRGQTRGRCKMEGTAAARAAPGVVMGEPAIIAGLEATVAVVTQALIQTVRRPGRQDRLTRRGDAAPPKVRSDRSRVPHERHGKAGSTLSLGGASGGDAQQVSAQQGETAPLEAQLLLRGATALQRQQVRPGAPAIGSSPAKGAHLEV